MVNHVCRIVSEVNGDECGKPTTRCIVCHSDDPKSPETVWLCEEHYNDLGLREAYENICEKVDY